MQMPMRHCGIRAPNIGFESSDHIAIASGLMSGAMLDLAEERRKPLQLSAAAYKRTPKLIAISEEYIAP